MMQIAVICSFILSILHSNLFFKQKVGISVLLFAISTIFLLSYVLEKNKKVKNKKAYILTIPILLLSSTYFIFNNVFFSILNVIVILGLLATMLVWMLNGKLEISLWLSKIFNIIIGPIEFIGNASSTIKEESKQLFYNSNRQENMKKQMLKKIIKAIVISIPILLIILFLLITADDNFANIFSTFSKYIMNLFTSMQIWYLIARILLIGILFIYFVSFLYNILNKNSSFNQIEEYKRKREIKIEGITINTMVTILNIIYALFSIVQIMTILEHREMTISQYSSSARQGFFQLMIVTFINLIIILIGNNNKKENSKKENIYLKCMNLLLIIFTIVLVIVSFQKMYLYENNYGYTLLRLLVYVTLITELILLIPTAIYVINRKINIFHYYFTIIIVMYVILNFINIDQIIAKRNVDRYIETGKIDIQYLTREISIDGMEQIKRVYFKIEEENKESRQVHQIVTNYLLNTRQQLIQGKESWQSFNIGRQKAKKQLEGLELKYKMNQQNSDNESDNKQEI